MQDSVTQEAWIDSVFESVQAFETVCGYSVPDITDYELTHLVYHMTKVNRYIVQDLARYMGIKPSAQSPGTISYFESPEKRLKGIRTRVKPGRFFRKFYPLATDQDCEVFSDKFKDLYAPREYELICSKAESAFVEAYTGKITEGTSYSDAWGEDFEIKSLSGSCMRKTFGFLHPAAAYASGDFTIVYAKEKKSGRIGARVVIGNDSAGPIYTNCNFATKVLVAYLKEEEIDTDSNWDGLKLAKIETSPGADQFLCPYLDGYGGVSDCDDYLEIGGDISFHTHGYVSIVPQEYCECCEEYCDADDMEEVYGGESVCNSCRSHRYTYSHLMHDYIPDSDCVSVDGDCATQDWIDSNGYVYCVYSGEYREESDCIEYGGEYYATDSSCVYEVEGDYYHEDSQEYRDAIEEKETRERLESLPYETVTVSKGFVWVHLSQGYGGPNVYLEYQEQKETRLRLNYELDSNGLPYRLPEFNFA